jgi:hypothetical protein
MEFFDSNCFFGLPPIKMLRPCPAAAELVGAMDRAGIGKALAWHVAQRDYSDVVGNRLLADAIKPHSDRLYGCWSIVPPQTGEMPKPVALVDAMVESNIKALRAFVLPRKFILGVPAFGDLFDLMFERRIPLFLPVIGKGGAGWQGAYDLLRDFPNLTCVLCNCGDWGPDMLFRPLLEAYPNVYFEISEYTLDGGIEAFVKDYGAARLLFGTGFPAYEHGGPMLSVKHAEISEEDKCRIASGNLEELLAWK